jgi:hypothetical protein
MADTTVNVAICRECECVVLAVVPSLLGEDVAREFAVLQAQGCRLHTLSVSSLEHAIAAGWFGHRAECGKRWA